MRVEYLQDGLIFMHIPATKVKKDATSMSCIMQGGEVSKKLLIGVS